MHLNRIANIDAQTLLHDAVEEDNIERVKILLNRGFCVNARDRDGKIALHHAIERNKTTVIKLLLSRGAYVDARDRDGKTPLHYAVEACRENVTELLLQYNPNVNINADCGTPLHLAVKEGYLQIVSDLLNQGANINSVCASTGFMPIHIAAVEGRADIAGLLLLNGASVNAVAKGNLSPLYMATKEGHCDTVKLLLERRAYVDAPNEDGKTALYCAVEMGYSNIVKEILKFSPHRLNESNRSSFYSAMLSNHGNIIQSLVENGFGVRPHDIYNRQVFYSAVKNGYLVIVKNLLYFGANVDTMTDPRRGLTLLHLATNYGQRKVAYHLIKCGADVNAKAANNRTPLFYAVHYGDSLIVKSLLANGAENDSETFNTAVTKGDIEIVKILLQCSPAIDINHTDTFGRTALHISARKGCEIITRMLLDKGAMVNAKNGDGNTALYIAVTMGHAKVVELLLEYGADVNCKSYYILYCNRPLHVAVERHYLEIVDILIKFGADVNARDSNGRTALNIMRFGPKPITVALLQNGSDINKSEDKEINLAWDYTGFFRQYISPEYCNIHETHAGIYVRHIVKLIANKLFVNETYLKVIDDDRYLKHYYIKCEREIQEMKNEKIHNTNVSFYDILIEDVHQLSIYAKNESIIEAFESTKYAEMFPIYADILEYQFKKGQEEHRFLKSSTTNLNSVFGYDLNVSINKIFSYLSHSDLKALENACS